MGNLAAALDSETAVLSRSVSNEIERYRYLPAIVARDSRLQDTLRHPIPAKIQALNEYLRGVGNDSGADEVYVLNSVGVTIAASNYSEAGSFVGQNYQFRPYFSDAMKYGSGRFYGVGVTTGMPGYFLSSVVRDSGRNMGVVAVKIDLLGIEQAWEKDSTNTALADSDGIIFLSGYPPWRYSPLFELNTDTLAQIDSVRKYDGKSVAMKAPVLTGSHRSVTALDRVEIPGKGAFMMRSRSINPDGWRLWSGSSLSPVWSTAALSSLSATLAGLLVWGAGLYMHQRRQLVRTRLMQGQVLEQRVVERTAELNREIEERRRTELELRTTQDSLIQSAKLAALGRMSTAIVHEVSQPLAAMENTLAAAGKLTDRGDTSGTSLKVRQARDLVKRIQQIVKTLKSFARNEAGTMEDVDVEAATASALELIQPRIRTDGVMLRFEGLPEPAIVRGNSIRLQQVVLNLAANAVDALKGREDPMLEVWIEQGSSEISIFVRDNGTGMEQSVKERVAEPFFTTKVTGDGLGLGLSISRAMIADVGGRLEFTSVSGEGSTFAIHLPKPIAPTRYQAAL
ncbi:two-component system, NtrC family, C4-dicarboxylate transport sensor histidine kinase DctB [Mesorhizobium albiziae]|uniref:histidine kinase n=2 Tax=Neomesorhizobium albiziae TaxID=335020 RepID=A0A1I3XWE7_9HYPH|nr:sensor histidine kinase [Mesorhizobium albiziae]SFK23865.1 two-component system, NtrC family, C4-dicarboxylate transport sensor histidine kinase DctB [Mesorhizobium albiziae]